MDLFDAWETATDLMEQHDLFDAGWRFEWDNAKRRAGATHFKDGKLTFSKPVTLLATPEEFRLTVLHEIAHALVGAKHGHDVVWQSTCRRIGGNAKRLTDQDVPPTPWTALHDGCDKLFGRHRIPKGNRYCPKCMVRPTRANPDPDNSKALLRWVRTDALEDAS